MQKIKKDKEFYEQFMDLIDNLSSPPKAGFIVRNFRIGLTDYMQYALSSHHFTRFNDLVKSAVNTQKRCSNTELKAAPLENPTMRLNGDQGTPSTQFIPPLPFH